MSSFIYREYRDRSNVGYGTMLAMVYLIIIIVFVTLLLKLVNRRDAAGSPEDGSTAAQDRRREQAAAQRGGLLASRVLIYGALLFWAFVSLFPIYWTITTSFKTAVDVHAGRT